MLPRRPGESRHPVSRDYALTGPTCACLPCVCNGGGRCEVPSKAILDHLGRCTTGKTYLDLEAKRNTKPPRNQA